MITVPEEWMPVVGYEDEYEVSTWGRVRRILGSSRAKTTRYLRPYYNEHGRPTVTLSKGGRKATLLVYRIVAESFLGPCPAGMEVNHKDGNTRVSWLANLEYATPRSNTQHAEQNGLRGYGNARLRPDQVREIRRLRGIMKQRDIAEYFGISRGQVQKIHYGDSWPEIA